MRAVLSRLVLAGISGGITFLSVEPRGWWAAGIIGIALLYAALSPLPWLGGKVSLTLGAGIACTHSAVLYLCTLPWIGELVGNMPYIALALFLSAYSIVLGIGGTALARWRYGFLAFPFLFAAVEMLRSSVPFGGFSWVRLAWGQIDGPLANLAPWGGPALITVATAFAGASLVRLAAPRADRRVRSTALAGVSVPLLLGLVAGLGINRDARTVGSIDIAAVQGNVPRMGLDFEAQRRAVLDNHVNVTEQAAMDGSTPDVVIWPENSSDINPFTNADAMREIKQAAKDIDAPILVGTATKDEVGWRNTMQVIEADGSVGDHHYKKYLQPFGETMPMRDFFRKITDMVDMAGDFKAGNGPGVVDMAGSVIGVATCYEVSFDQAFRSSITHGAQILTTPTNNATFGYSDMTYQQLAMSRLRALETDRAVVVAATSGVSAIVHPDGTVSQHSEIFEPRYLEETLPLRTGTTCAVRYGSLLQWLMAIIGTVCALAAVYTARRGEQTRGRAPHNKDATKRYFPREQRSLKQ